jgi:hypothetical protein
MIPAISSFISASHMTSCAVLASSRTATCHTVVSVSWSKHIFPHLYSLEAPVLWRPHRRKLALSRKHFRNAFLMK